MRLKDKVAIITGGSRGIGYAAADKFLKEGAAVIVTASTQGSADRAVTKLKEKYPDAIVDGISPDLASLESVRKAFKEVTGKYGCVDILVNNAGISESTPFMEYTEETYDKVNGSECKKEFLRLSRAAAECMVARGEGVIHFHFLHGQYFRTAKRICLSGIKICSKRLHDIFGKRAGT